MERTELQRSFQKYIDGQYTQADLDKILTAIVEGDMTEEQLLEILQSQSDDAELSDPIWVDHIATNVGRELFSKVQSKKKVKKLIWLPYAAAILLVFGIGLYLNRSVSVDESTEAVALNNIVEPGTNRAKLVLSNGKTISLDQNKGQIVSSKGEVRYGDGGIIDGSSSNIESERLSIITPRGGQYQVVLPDGTKVWLNSESYISFPERFEDNERLVELYGELFLEVAHNPSVPFRVKMQGQVITVKGTSFNIHAYQDENFSNTTLLTGKIDVATNGGKSLQLTPGQMLHNSDGAIQIKPVNIESVVAWKNGYFLFDRTPLKGVMQQISRWYDVDVEYASGESIDEVFGGSIARNVNLREVLNVLEETGDVRFEMKGKKVIVHKKTTK